LISETGTHESAVDLGWLVEALDYARAEGQTRLLDHLESIADDVVFEMESSSRSA
jgi:hypothetical protein